METRLTLRINGELNKQIEKEKLRTGLSKNTIILEACKELLNKTKRKRLDRS